jgi:hypothetical protein
MAVSGGFSVLALSRHATLYMMKWVPELFWNFCRFSVLSHSFKGEVLSEIVSCPKTIVSGTRYVSGWQTGTIVSSVSDTPVSDNALQQNINWTRVYTNPLNLCISFH